MKKFIKENFNLIVSCFLMLFLLMSYLRIAELNKFNMMLSQSLEKMFEAQRKSFDAIDKREEIIYRLLDKKEK